MIRLNVFIQVEDKNRTAVLDIAKRLVSASLEDEGCIAYDIFESSTRKNVLMICETWKDEASLAAHSAKPHFTTLVPEIESLATMKIEQFIF
ncbi:MAG: antibiotic biosynthesis monooxygenase [Dysgonamonadaceae bacterium]|jgi:quinol monooxygenase YgiN|nr:antibiotic biosynthesis monooxygenase [Dysgonamonadaceae bacterium]